MNSLLGEQPAQAYATRDEVVAALTARAAGAPVREEVALTGLRPAGDAFDLDTDHGPLRARVVVVATGNQNLPRVPAIARDLPARIVQCHAGDYRHPAALPDGAVLVVGSRGSPPTHRPQWTFAGPECPPSSGAPGSPATSAGSTRRGGTPPANRSATGWPARYPGCGSSV